MFGDNEHLGDAVVYVTRDINVAEDLCGFHLQFEVMIDRRYHRSLQVFSWAACAAMTVKLVLFTEYGTRRGHGEHEHVFSGIQRYTDKQLDKFFGVEDIKKQAHPDQQSSDVAVDKKE